MNIRSMWMVLAVLACLPGCGGREEAPAAAVSAKQGETAAVFEALDRSDGRLAGAVAMYEQGDTAGAKRKLLDYFRSRGNVRWFFERGERERLTAGFRRRFPGRAAETVARADSLLAGKWFWSGRYWDCGFPPRWEEDKGDIEYTVALNRHFFLGDLGLAYWLTGDEKYARAFSAVINDWIDSTTVPAEPYLGEHLPWKVLEVGIRPKNWFAAWEYFIGSPEFSSDLLIRIVHSLILHKDFLRRSTYLTLPEYASEDNYMSNAAHNHYTMEMEGLHCIALMLPELQSSADDRRFAVAQLGRCQEAQILDDGVHIEETPGYHAGCIRWFAAPMLLGELNGHPFGDAYRRKLRKMFCFVSHIMRPDYTIAPFGDSPVRKEFDVISLGRILFDTPATAQQTMRGRMGEDAVLTPWLFWLSNGREPQVRLAEPDFPLNAAFEKGGFFCMRSSWSERALYLAMRNGRGWHDQSGHQHADHLSIDVSAYGSPLITDPGRYTYVENEWRKYFKATRNHNTISVNGESSIEYLNRWRWGPFPETGESEMVSDRDRVGISAWHDGFAPVRCRRKIDFVENRFWIVDDLVSGLEGDSVMISYTFHGTEAGLVGGGYTGARLTESAARASVAVVQVVGGLSASLEDGWYSESYLHKEPCRVLRFTGENLTGECRSVCLVIPFPPGEKQDYAITVRGGEATVSIGGSDPFSGTFRLD